MITLTLIDPVDPIVRKTLANIHRVVPLVTGYGGKSYDKAASTMN